MGSPPIRYSLGRSTVAARRHQVPLEGQEDGRGVPHLSNEFVGGRKVEANEDLLAFDRRTARNQRRLAKHNHPGGMFAKACRSCGVVHFTHQHSLVWDAEEERYRSADEPDPLCRVCDPEAA